MELSERERQRKRTGGSEGEAHRTKIRSGGMYAARSDFCGASFMMREQRIVTLQILRPGAKREQNVKPYSARWNGRVPFHRKRSFMSLAEPSE